MDPQIERSSSKRKWWWLAAAAVVFAVVFTWLEDLVRPNSRDAAPSGAEPRAVASPAPPEVRRLDGGGIEIRHDFFRRTTIRLQDEEKEESLYACLTQGIDERFGNGTEGWNRGRFERETLEVRFECLQTVREVPPPP